jgi:hypothetical protein
MARKRKGLVQTAAALAATALVEKAIQKAAEDPRVRRKVKSVGTALKKRAKAARSKISKAISRQVSKAKRTRAGTRRKSARAAPRRKRARA